MLNDENEDENEGQYNVITNYDYPVNIYYDKGIKDELHKIFNSANKDKLLNDEKYSQSGRTTDDVSGGGVCFGNFTI